MIRLHKYSPSQVRVGFRLEGQELGALVFGHPFGQRGPVHGTLGDSSCGHRVSTIGQSSDNAPPFGLCNLTKS